MSLHPRNKHQGKYDFDKLVKICPELESHITKNPKGEQTIDFFNKKSVVLLNKALLQSHYGITYWELPEDKLCPPIPGRTDYIHYVADLLLEERDSIQGEDIRCLDIGVGAGCIYPLIGYYEYGWSFVATDIDEASIKSSIEMCHKNGIPRKQMDFRVQKNPNKIFNGVLKTKEKFDLTICNPPFHASQEEALNENRRKNKQLTGVDQVVQNFGGSSKELWCRGGELAFIMKMIYESEKLQKSVDWFTTLVSKKDTIKELERVLKKVDVKEYKVVEMKHGNKNSRILAWRY